MAIAQMAPEQALGIGHIPPQLPHPIHVQTFHPCDSALFPFSPSGEKAGMRG